jgi:hypothetical protein
MTETGPRPQRVEVDNSPSSESPRRKVALWAGIAAAVPILGGIIGVILKGPSALAIVWGLVIGPRIEAYVSQCEPKQLTLQVRNWGGRPARISAPTFWKSVDGRREEIPRDAVGDEPIASGTELPALSGWKNYTYRAEMGVFLAAREAGTAHLASGEKASTSCQLSATIPLASSGGQMKEVQAQPPCDCSQR